MLLLTRAPKLSDSRTRSIQPAPGQVVVRDPTDARGESASITSGGLPCLTVTDPVPETVVTINSVTGDRQTFTVRATDRTTP